MERKYIVFMVGISVVCLAATAWRSGNGIQISGKAGSMQDKAEFRTGNGARGRTENTGYPDREASRKNLP